jgi:dCMP deaminase
MTTNIAETHKTAEQIIEEWKKNQKIVKVTRPSWDEYFIKLAHVIKLRSLDSQTKHGCVITTKDHTPIAFGYNSFIRNVDDSVLPNVRNEKYNVVIHAELNSLLNCCRSGHSTKGCIAYVTGLPCPHCIQSLFQSGVEEIVYDSNGLSKMLNNQETKDFYTIFKYLTKDKLIIREINDIHI